MTQHSASTPTRQPIPRSRNLEGAVRAAAAGGVPLVVLVILGMQQYAAFALFAGFTAIFGAREQYRHRIVTTTSAGILQVLCMLGGLAIGMAHAALWVEALGLVAVLIVSCALLTVLGTIPAQPIFPVFAFLVAALVPLRATELPGALLVIVASVVFAWCVALSGAVLRRLFGRRHPRWFRQLAPEPRRSLTVLRQSALWETVGLNVVGALIAGAIAVSLPGLGHPYWAVVAVVSTLPAMRQRHTVQRSLHRVLGTYGGVIIAVLVLSLHPDVWWVVVLAFLGQFGAEIFVAKNYAVALLFLTPLALSVSWLSLPEAPAALALDRTVQTTLGAPISVLLLLAGRAVERRRGRALGVTSSIRTV
ncbi:FUSC family protein [Curtobacterium ammoniigenes]|uniref:FUSC family protein n=1 Tax=Curtobacterium ammoniigenes TaxID=395387 RepID=UPI00082F002B|nr:FUSC family protein [Curtobacterium ammoniigenes]